MESMKLKIWSKLAVSALVVVVFALNGAVVWADEPNVGDTILPGAETSLSDCELWFQIVTMDEIKGFFDGENVSREDTNKALGCAIKTGRIKLWMVPYFIRYILEFIFGIGGLVAVGGVIYGGFVYLFAGLSEDKDRGKKAILYGIIGLVLMFSAWAVVNIVIALLTS